MRHEVPQFIDIEDKIIGPLTFTQGLYTIGGFFGGFAIFYIIGKIFPDANVIIKIIPGIPIFAFGMALAFLEVNKRPFIKYLEAWFYYTIHPKRYNWKKKTPKINKNVEDGVQLFREENEPVYQLQGEDYSKLSKRSKLKDIANVLDMDY